MELQILGSGAADGIPGFFSESRVSRWARKHGGKDVRARSGAVLDGTVKIDFGPDTFAAACQLGLNPLDWNAIVFTHGHEDHFCVSELQYALFPFTESHEAPFTIYGNEKIIQAVQVRYPDWPFELKKTESFQPVQADQYLLTPIAANHDPDEDCQNLIFSRDGVSFCYATDTGVWGDRTWEFLESVRLDGLVIECTDGFRPSGYEGHLSIETCVAMVNRLREKLILNANAPVFTIHHSHDGDGTHQELIDALAPHQIQPSYDGLLATFT